MQNALRIPLSRSRLLAVILVAAHALTLWVIWESSLPIALHLGLKLLLLLSLVYNLDQAGWLRPGRAPVLLRILPAGREDAADGVELAFASGKALHGKVLPGSLVLPLCIVLQFRIDGAPWWKSRGQLILLPDAATAEDRRALRVRLRWGRHAPV